MIILVVEISICRMKEGNMINEILERECKDNLFIGTTIPRETLLDILQKWEKTSGEKGEENRNSGREQEVDVGISLVNYGGKEG